VHSFQHLAAPLRLFHGADCLARLPGELDRLGSRRAIVFCGRSVASGPALALVRDCLGEQCCGVYDGVRAHSPVDAVQAGADALLREHADAVVALGGGSALVTARAAAIVAAEQRPVAELCTRRLADGRLESPRLAAKKLPQIAVLTTPTTACVKAGSAVLDTPTRQRLALFDPKTRAQALFIHPELALSAPPVLALTASLNTLALAVEGLESAAGDPLSEGQLMQAMRLLARALPALGRRPEDAAVRGELMLAAVLCGLGTDHAGGGIAAALGHALGAHCGGINGLLQSILLPHTMRFNASATEAHIGRVTEALGGAGAGIEAAVARVDSLLTAAVLPRRLRDAGVARVDLQHVAQAAMGDWFVQRNPRPASQSDLLEVLHAAW